MGFIVNGKQDELLSSKAYQEEIVKEINKENIKYFKTYS